MPTKMVFEAGVSPVDSLESGVEATLRLIADPYLDGVTQRASQGSLCGAAPASSSWR